MGEHTTPVCITTQPGRLSVPRYAGVLGGKLVTEIINKHDYNNNRVENGGAGPSCSDSCPWASYTRTHARTHAHTHTHTFNGFFPGLPGSAGTRKVKPMWILLKQETVSDSGISWAVCKSAPRSRQITTPAPHYSVCFQAGCPSCRSTNSVKAPKASQSPVSRPPLTRPVVSVPYI